MSESVDDFLTHDHDRLDELIAIFQERKDDNSGEATEFLAEFTAGLLRHLVWEESILFPLFEQKTAQTAVTNTLRAEHEEIRVLSAAMRRPAFCEGGGPGRSFSHPATEAAGARRRRDRQGSVRDAV